MDFTVCDVIYFITQNFFSVSVSSHAFCFEHKLERTTQDTIRITTIKGHVKIKNNSPVSLDKLIYV